MTERIAGLLGKSPQRQGADRFVLRWVHEYAHQFTAMPVYPLDVSANVSPWLMLGNGPDPTLTITTPNGPGQPVGDCVPVGVYHDKMIPIALGHLPEAEPTADQVVTIYDMYDHNQDVGAVIADFLLWAYQQKIIAAFAPVHPDQIDNTMATFNRGVILGVELTDTDMGNFELSPPVTWTSGPANPPNPNNGHCVLAMRSASATGPRTIVTWGDVQDVDHSWMQRVRI